MIKNFEYYKNEIKKINNECDNKIEELINEVSLKDVCKMIIDEYNSEKRKESLLIFIEYGYSEVLEYFSEKYDDNEICNYIKENFKEKMIEEKNKLDFNKILDIINSYNDIITEYDENKSLYDNFIYENGNFYGIKEYYKTNIE